MPWALQTWIEGEVATPHGLIGSSAFALDLAHLVASLRQADTRGRRFDGQGRGGHLSDHDDWMSVCFENSEGLLDVARLRNLWTRFRELPSAGSVVMSHRDLIPANLLVQGGRLVGVLDGGSFGPADPSLDLVAAWHLLDRERRATFRRVLQVEDLWWKRVGHSSRQWVSSGITIAPTPQ
ncbi:phosphotransferase [Mesorhizobium sp. M1378]